MWAQIGLKLKVEPDMLGVMCTRWPAACALRISCVRARTSIPSTRRIRRPSVGVLIAESLCDQRLKRTRLRVGRLARRVAGAVAWRDRFAASVKAVGRLLLLLRVMWPQPRWLCVDVTAERARALRRDGSAGAFPGRAC